MIKNKINVMHLIQNLGVGGAEILLLHYLKALGEDEFNHLVYSIGSEGPMKKKIETLGVPLTIGKQRSSIRHPIRFSTDLFTMTIDLIHFVKIHHIQIIQSHLGQANQIGVLIGKIANIPVITTVHNTNAFIYSIKKLGKRAWLHKFIDRIIYRMADKIVAVSQEVKNITQSALHLDESRILAVKNGIIFDEKEIVPLDIAKELGVSEDVIFLVGVGSLTYQKGFEVLIEASAEILQKGFSNFRTLIIGEGRERKLLEQLIGRLNVEHHVILMGFKKNVGNFLKSAHIFVMPSRFEGLSIAMIEAMACRLPIIASNVPGLKTYIQEGYNGLLFPKESHTHLANQILRLVEDIELRTHLGMNSYNTYKCDFDMRKNIFPLKNLYYIYAGKDAKPLESTNNLSVS